MIGIVLAVGAATVALEPYTVGVDTGRDALLVDPAPYPYNTVDSPDRLENGRLWIASSPVSSRTPVPETRFGTPSAAWYGAAPNANYEVAYMRVGTQAIAIDPFARIYADGFKDYRQARNLWLREQGYVLSVRTHVNPRYHVMSETRAYQEVNATTNDLPAPRATIRLKSDEEQPKKLRASVDSLREGDRVVKPDLAPVSGPAISYDEWLALNDEANPAEPTLAEATTDAEEPGA